MQERSFTQRVEDHIEIARLMAGPYNPEISLVPPKVYDEVVGRSWKHAYAGDKTGAAILKAAAGVPEPELLDLREFQ